MGLTELYPILPGICPKQGVPHAEFEFLHVEGFGDIIYPAGFQTGDFINLPVPFSEKDYGDAGCGK